MSSRIDKGRHMQRLFRSILYATLLFSTTSVFAQTSDNAKRSPDTVWKEYIETNPEFADLVDIFRWGRPPYQKFACDTLLATQLTNEKIIKLLEAKPPYSCGNLLFVRLFQNASDDDLYAIVNNGELFRTAYAKLAIKELEKRDPDKKILASMACYPAQNPPKLKLWQRFLDKAPADSEILEYLNSACRSNVIIEVLKRDPSAEIALELFRVSTGDLKEQATNYLLSRLGELNSLSIQNLLRDLPDSYRSYAELILKERGVTKRDYLREEMRYACLSVNQDGPDTPCDYEK